MSERERRPFGLDEEVVRELRSSAAKADKSLTEYVEEAIGRATADPVDHDEMPEEAANAEWQLLTIRAQPAGPSYWVDVMDGGHFAVERFSVGGVSITVDERADVECREFRILNREPGEGGATLYVEPNARSEREVEDG